MEQVFQEQNLELMVADFGYEITKAFIDKDNLILLAAVFPQITKALDGEVVISDNHRIYVSVKVKIMATEAEDGEVKVICKTQPGSFNFFKRSFLRLKTDIPVAYTYLKMGEADELIPSSATHMGALKDLNTCGACLEIANYGNFLLEEIKNHTIYLKLTFILPDESEHEQGLEIIGKIVNAKKTWDKLNVGLLFIIKAYREYRIVERYYNKRVKGFKEDDEMLLNNDTLRNWSKR